MNVGPAGRVEDELGVAAGVVAVEGAVGDDHVESTAAELGGGVGRGSEEEALGGVALTVEGDAVDARRAGDVLMPVMVLGFMGTGVWLASIDAPKWQIVTLLVGAVAVSFAAERVVPYETAWNADRGTPGAMSPTRLSTKGYRSAG